MKVDVVIPLAAQSLHDDFELRHSLRSLAVQDWVNEVYIVGYKPEWLTNIHHLPAPDPYTNKDANLIHKIMWACRFPVTQKFVVTSDDQYLMRPVSLEELGPWSDPDHLAHAVANRTRSVWNMRLIDSVRYCQRHGLPEFVLDSHIPYLVDKTEYLRVWEGLPYNQGCGLVTHLYFNLTLSEAPPNIPLGMAVHPREPNQAIPDPIPTFYNYNRNNLSDELKDWLRARFPDPSPWEA